MGVTVGQALSMLGAAFYGVGVYIVVKFIDGWHRRFKGRQRDIFFKEFRRKMERGNLQYEIRQIEREKQWKK